MNKAKDECSCGGTEAELSCRLCGNTALLPYWCETCQRLVAEKRCPCCGLKARKVGGPAECDVNCKPGKKT